MENTDLIEATIKKTLDDVAKTGFEDDRIQAILHRTELSLKKQVRCF
jgi:Zn-dependent M16 (insulinase) family peptidase